VRIGPHRFAGVVIAMLVIVSTTMLGVTSAGATASKPVSGPVVPVPPAVHWGPCSDPGLIADHAQCGFVSVPLDYTDPGGTHIQLAVSRILHTSTASHYQGSLLTNPGGPGGSGLALNPDLISALDTEGYKAAAADYDWIGFDPRGVGSSLPAISCNPDYLGPDRPNYMPTTSHLLEVWLARSQSYAQDCGNHSALQSALLRNMTTRDVAMDMDSIRSALGQKQITYYGFSYGTDLGQVYSTLYPTHVRRLIMDSNIDPLNDGYQDFNLDQDGPFNRNVNIWFGWLAKYNRVYHLGSTEASVQAKFYAAEKRLVRHPAGGKVGPDEWADIFVETGYYEQTWVQFGQILSDWITKHNAAAANELVAAYESIDTPGDDNELAVYSAVVCTDSHWPLDWNTWEHDVSAIYQKAPFEAWSNAWFNGACLFWPTPSSDRVHVNGSGVASALLIDETLDAATPFAGSLAVRKLFPKSVLVAEPGGTSHADSLFGDKCVDGTIAAYLESGALPPRRAGAKWDKTCAPLPQPVPSATGSEAEVPAPNAPSLLPARLKLASVLAP
jgi:pimeloyl-ACP methyl ester carboxylesterase